MDMSQVTAADVVAAAEEARRFDPEVPVPAPQASTSVAEQVRRSPHRAPDRTPLAGPVLLPVNVGLDGAALVGWDPSTAAVRSITQVPGSRFVYGDDNEAFGAWNALLGAEPARGQLTRVPGHGGEIIPGRLADHVEALRRRVRTGQPAPVQLDIDPTMTCPSKCLFCFSAPYRDSRKTDRRLDTALLLSVVERWIALGVKVVRFDGGGDPLAHPGCVDAIRHAARLGARTAVLTAGDLLDTADFPTFVEARTYVRVSVNAGTDAVRQTVHRTQARTLPLRGLLARMRQLARLRQLTYGSAARRAMPLGATFMIHPANVRDIVAAARVVRDVGFDHISFRVVLGEPHAVRFSSEERACAQRQLAEVAALADDEYRVFVPTRNLTDSGYVPSRYFDSCVAASHRVLVEVGSTREEAAIVPCGRYRGHGFRASEVPSDHVLGTIRATSESQPDESRAEWLEWLRPVAVRYPRECGDCIDRSANILLNGMLAAIRRDAGVRFYRIRVLDE